MRITRIEIENLGGIEREELEPLDVNLRVGRNATGKTSWVRALQAAFSGGDNQELIRKGAEEGSVRVCLEMEVTDSPAGGGIAPTKMEISRRFRAGKTPITEVLIDGRKQTNPQTIIKGLLDSFAIDIREWLSAKEERKTALILESMPLRISDGDVIRLVSALPGHLIEGLSGKIPHGHAIEVLAKMRKEVFSLRTDENRDAKRLKASIEALKQAMPPKGAEGVSNKELLAEAEQRLSDLEATKSTMREEVISSVTDKLIEIQERKNQAIAKIENEFVKDSSALEEQKHKDLNEIDVAFVTEAMELKSSIERARAAAENEVRAEGLRGQIEQQKAALKKADETIASLEKTLTSIDEYRTGLLRGAPIAGLEMSEEGRLTLGGIELEQVNTARLLELSLDLAALRMDASGDDSGLRTVFVDNFECLDEEHRRRFIEGAKTRGIQVFGGMLAESDAQTLRE